MPFNPTTTHPDLPAVRRPASDGLGADPVGEVMVVEPRELTLATMPARFAELGDLHAGIDDVAFSLDPLLEWAARDERAGAADPGSD